jgi:hypothetical protein
MQALLHEFCRNLCDPVEHVPLSCRGTNTSYFSLNGFRTSGVESTFVAFSDTFLIEKINFFYYFLHTEKETKERSLHRGAVGYTCTMDLSHILSFHANCIWSASQPIYIASQLDLNCNCTIASCHGVFPHSKVLSEHSSVYLTEALRWGRWLIRTPKRKL